MKEEEEEEEMKATHSFVSQLKPMPELVTLSSR